METLKTWKDCGGKSSKSETVVGSKGLDRNIERDDEVMTQSVVSNLDSKLSETPRLITPAHPGYLGLFQRLPGKWISFLLRVWTKVLTSEN